MSNSSLIKLRRSAVPYKLPTVEQLELGELAVNTHDGKLYLKVEKDQEQSVIEFTANIPIDNTFFVRPTGDDLSTGTSWSSAVATIEKAIELANERDGETTLIDIAPGTYETEGFIDIPDNCIIRAVHRTAIIVPKVGYEESNVFRMGSGCFIEGPVFEGWRIDDLENPTVGFAIAFRPGAMITRVPYVHKIVVRSDRYWDTVAPPLDRDNQNPLVGIGGGVVLADGAVLSPYSIFPNIMTWGATPVSHNGIGYCAKNGALINAVNAVSLWAHKHFYALDGGQIVLSSCSTQFGDFTMVSKGARQIVSPQEVSIELSTNATAAASIITNRDDIIDDMWNALVSNGYTTTWNSEDEVFTRRDAGIFLQSISWVIQTANEKPMLDFAKGLFDYNGVPVFSSDKLSAFIFAFEFMRDGINNLSEFDATFQNIVTDLVSALSTTIQQTETRLEPSIITAIGHTWSGIMAGVALTKIPPARNLTTIRESILELDQGVVISSGQDDEGSALFVGGLEINADTGELTGPPFDQAVNRIATRAVIARSY
jgi:hypothetical protein